MRRWSEEGQTSNKKIPALQRDFFVMLCAARFLFNQQAWGFEKVCSG
jgi:hypothetical protein